MKDISEQERRFIAAEDTMTPNGYNLTEGGEGCIGCKRSNETKTKLRKAHLGMRASAETRRKMSATRTGKVFGDEIRAKISESQMGKRNHRFGKRMSDEQKERLSVVMSGRGNPFWGKRHSESSIELMRKNARRRCGLSNHSARSVIIGDKRFDTMSDAAKFVGISMPLMHKRINSLTWSDYNYEVAK